MTQLEQTRLLDLNRTLEGGLTASEAGQALSLSVRQVRRTLAADTSRAQIYSAEVGLLLDEVESFLAHGRLTSESDTVLTTLLVLTRIHPVEQAVLQVGEHADHV